MKDKDARLLWEAYTESPDMKELSIHADRPHAGEYEDQDEQSMGHDFDGLKQMVVDTLHGDLDPGDNNVSIVQDPSRGASTYEFVKNITKQFMSTDLERNKERIEPWLMKIIETGPTTGMPFSDQQRANLKSFYTRFLHKLMMILDTNGQQGANRYLDLLLNAIAELEIEIEQDGVSSLDSYATRLNDPE